jgi:hypothetical protein
VSSNEAPEHGHGGQARRARRAFAEPRFDASDRLAGRVLGERGQLLVNEPALPLPPLGLAAPEQVEQLPLDVRRVLLTLLAYKAAISRERLQVGQEPDDRHLRCLVRAYQQFLGRRLHLLGIESAQRLDQPLALRVSETVGAEAISGRARGRSRRCCRPFA